MTRYDEKEECRQYRVTGRVQGVFFRDSTRQVAESLKLTGHARNVPDGSVEILACGSPESLGKLESWLQSGPPRAEVGNVEAVAVDVAKPPSFRIA